MNDRDLMKGLGIEFPQPEGNRSGIVSRQWLSENGIIVFTPNQLKNVAQMLNQKAQTMTIEEIEREAAMAGDISASPEEESRNKQRVGELIESQRAAIDEKMRQYREWEAKQKQAAM
jgi:DNA-binding transcriptional MerR regulator